MQFLDSIRESKWLFGDDLQRYLYDDYYVGAEMLLLSRDQIEFDRIDLMDASAAVKSAVNKGAKQIARDEEDAARMRLMACRSNTRCS